MASPRRAAALRYVSFSIGNDTYTFPVQGEVDAINLDSGLTYLTGPLYGEVTINDVYYQVSVGFNKVMERDGVSFCMLMTPVNVGQRQTLVFSFGEKVLTNEIHTELNSKEKLHASQSSMNGAVTAENPLRASTNKGSATGLLFQHSTSATF